MRRLQGGWLVADGLWGVSVENFTYDTKLIRAVTGYKTYVVINCDYCFCCPLLFWVHFFRQMPTTSFKNIQYAKESTKAKWTLYTLNKIKKILSSFDFNFNYRIWRLFKKNKMIKMCLRGNYISLCSLSFGTPAPGWWWSHSWVVSAHMLQLCKGLHSSHQM